MASDQLDPRVSVDPEYVYDHTSRILAALARQEYEEQVAALDEALAVANAEIGGDVEPLKARYATSCRECGRDVHPGDAIAMRHGKWIHARCVEVVNGEGDVVVRISGRRVA